MKIIRSETARSFSQAINKLDSRLSFGSTGVESVVSEIIRNVRTSGDKSLLAYTKKFDRVSYTTRSMKVSDAEISKASISANPKVVRALKLSAARIKQFHKRQKEQSWKYTRNGATLGQLIRPLDSAGIYVPGGKASYPSSVLMNAIPAKIAGVRRVVMVTPTPDGEINPHVLVAAKIAGVDEIYKVGGAQAVAALAFGTKTIASVDKIVGPGNVYVAEAKRQVYGKVDIDMIAGPSEILVLADGTADPSFIAADLLSQAEHDENAYPILVTTSLKLADKVADELKTQTGELGRSSIIKKCLSRNCYGFVVKSVKEGIELSNRIAPEHMELMVKNPFRYISQIKNAGALFVGEWTPEALGDYAAGPNHVLPTGGSARFFSPLGVYDFVKRTSLLSFTRGSLGRLAGPVTDLAYEEGLNAHAKAVEKRINKQK
ncbi:Histidinol dehydrogenase [hydrothermal vent metagenome]|uniref:Histidinol dehydrogenase n=1 Tax=hydrothermal vent metagenome TaxID=652676 RepID=A0A3B1CG97_9ZZZZ